MQAFITNTKCLGPIYKPSFITNNESIKDSIQKTNEKDAQQIDECEMSRITTSWIHRINFHVASKIKSKSQKTCIGGIA